MSRLYVAESDLTVTGGKADHRLAVAPPRIWRLITALAAQMGLGDARMPGDLTPAEAAWLSAVATDLDAHRGRCLVLAGSTQPDDVQQAAFALTAALGGVGRTLRVVPPVLQGDFDLGTGHWPGSSATAFPGAFSLALDQLRKPDARHPTVIVLADNPARAASLDYPVAQWLAEISRRPDAFTAHLGSYANETSFNCQWHVPATHELESWGDAVAFDGTPSLIQPLIAPLTGGRSAIDVLNALLGRPDRSAYDTVRDFWKSKRSLDAAAFDAWWTDTLRRGVIDRPEPIDPRDATEPAGGTPTFPSRRQDADSWAGRDPAGPHVVFAQDPAIGDGAGFHNPWLQELPRPMTKIVWGNAALVGPTLAGLHGIVDNDVVNITAGDRSIDIPAVVQAGIADDTIVLHVGYGEHKLYGGETDTGSSVTHGTDVFPLWAANSPGLLSGVTLKKTGGRGQVVRTHNHAAMAVSAEVAAQNAAVQVDVIATPQMTKADLKLRNRKLIRTATLDEFKKSPDFAAKMDGEKIEQLYPGWNYATGPQWGMSIDLNACIGCGACVTACQAENNTPSVGPDQVEKQREMHWLRVDSYPDDAGRVHHQPVACMHCENAPCEYVCPVAATTHSVEGLNQMTYNRCVGTRYCSNNCPYKVRRFNFLDYTSGQPRSHAMQKNPDVTVRARGVMEKCTYCVQRINYATRKTEIATLKVDGDATQFRRDMIGRLQTACQQTCPTQAIRFGDLTDTASAVTRDKKDPRSYGLLVELTTKPRTTYLAAITNPNPAMETLA